MGGTGWAGGAHGLEGSGQVFQKVRWGQDANLTEFGREMTKIACNDRPDLRRLSALKEAIVIRVKAEFQEFLRKDAQLRQVKGREITCQILLCLLELRSRKHFGVLQQDGR